MHGRSAERVAEALGELLDGPGDVRRLPATWPRWTPCAASPTRCASEPAWMCWSTTPASAPAGRAPRVSATATSCASRSTTWPASAPLDLLDRLRGGAPARIVNVSSLGQQAIDFDDVMLEPRYDGARAYCQSKLAQILFTFDLAPTGRAEA